MTTVTLLLLSRSVSSVIIGLIATAETTGILLGSARLEDFHTRPDRISTPDMCRAISDR